MKKLLLPLAFALYFNANCQVLNHQSAISSKAERSLQFKISDAPNDVLEIVNHTSADGQFQPAIWAHRESANGNVLALSAHITSAVDTGTSPLFNIVGAKGIFDNNAPYTSQFPWGNGGTGLPIVNRPILSISNAYTSLVTVAANGNFGIGTTNPLSKLHNIGTVRLESLPNLSAGCSLKINSVTGEVGIDPTSCSRVPNIAGLEKLPIINAIKTVSKIETFKYIDEENSINSGFNIEKAELKNTDYQTIIPYLLESIKELNAKIEELEIKLSSNNSNIKNEFNVKVYPNPVKDIFNIYFENSNNSIYSVILYDNSGKQIISKSETPKNKIISLNISNLISGIYYYEIKINGSNHIQKGKLVKE